jgi:glycosyltransferase involved in cell wall biosynthesis
VSGKLRIAQVTTSSMALRLLLLDQIHALQALGHEVIAICGPGPWVQELRENGVTVQTVPMRREASPVADVRSLAELYGCFRRYRFDVVHTHTPKAGVLGPIAARMAGVPVVVHTIHGLMFHDRMSRAKQMLYWCPEKVTAACAHRLFSQSREDVDRAIAARLCPAGKITWIGNGVDLRRFSPEALDGAGARLRREMGFKEDDFVVGCVGRLVKDKGWSEIFDAAESLSPRYPKLKFLIIGVDEAGHREAVSLCRLNALAQRGVIVFAGTRRDMPRCYAAMNALVHPSHREGVPRVCLEASAMARPVIAADIRGCREAVIANQTGVLVPVRDARALADAIESLMADTDRRRAMGIAGRKHVTANFDDRMMLQRVIEVYEQIERELLRATAAAGASG